MNGREDRGYVGGRGKTLVVLGFVILKCGFFKIKDCVLIFTDGQKC